MHMWARHDKMVAASAITVIMFIACICVAHARDLQNSGMMRRSLAGQRISRGWWYSIKIKNGTTYCGLRDFPPASNGYGASRLYCIFPSYDHYWMWRVLKVDGTSNLTSGDQVFITIYNPMPYKFCQLRSNVVCGYQNGTAFNVEKANGSGSINLSTDDVVFRVGSNYCSLSGAGHNQQLTCTQANRSRATVFQVQASSVSQFQLTNRLTVRPCGGYFYPMGAITPDTVGCVITPAPGFTTGLTLALQTPGTPLIEAGTRISFKSYDDTYTYHVATWMQRNNEIRYASEVTVGNTQWFTLERLLGSSAVGGELTNATAVAIRSTQTSSPLYCGMRSRNATALLCDNPGPLSSLPDGYKYTYLLI